MAQAADYNSTWAGAVRAAANRGQLSHAVILTGEGDKLSPARYIAAAHLCRSEGQRPCLQCNACRKVMEGIHPDVTEVRDDDRKELAVDTIRALRQDVYIRPNEGERKVYLFTDCAQLNERDQNVLLKIVEEGPAYAAFVFCADTLHALLPTIRSRCVELRLEGQDAALEENEAAAELCRVLARRDPLALAAHLTGLENRRMKREQLLAMSADQLTDTVFEIARHTYEAKEAAYTPKIMRELERVIMLRVVDEYWMDNIDAMDDLKQGIGLRAYGQHDPVVAYKE